MVKPILIAPSKKLNQISTKINSTERHTRDLFRDLEDTLLFQKDPQKMSGPDFLMSLLLGQGMGPL
jgi:peptide deformylase